MEKEYTVSLAMKFFYGIIAVIIIGFVIAMFFMPKAPQVTPLVYLLPVLMLVPVIFIINIVRRKIFIEEDRIRINDLFSQQELLISDIKGYRTERPKGGKTFVLDAVSTHKPALRIRNLSNYNNSDELANWVTTHFNNLDAIDIENDHTNLLHDSTLGATETERLQKLGKAKQIAMLYNVLALLVGFMALLSYHKFIIELLLIYPLIGIGLIASGKGLINFQSSSKASLYPSIIFGFMITAIFPALLSVKFQLLDYHNLWMPFMLISLLLIGMMYLVIITRWKSKMPIRGQLITIIVISLIYGFGLTIHLNCFFDPSKLKIFHARVLYQHVVRGKNNAYYLALSSWGPRKQQRDLQVRRWLYEKTSVGDTVKIRVKEGLFHAPWYGVDK